MLLEKGCGEDICISKALAVSSEVGVEEVGATQDVRCYNI